MSDDFTPEFRDELLDDFYAECDEHLANVRAQLAALEQSFGRGEANSTALESIYRSVHSFKGNAAIVGLSSGEHLAHATEGLLRALTRGEAALSAAALDLIGQASHRLEQIVTTFRLHQPMPETTRLVEELSAFQSISPREVVSPTSPTAPSIETASTSAFPSGAVCVKGARAQGALPWRATFTPAAELDRRGVNVTAVRQRLGALGEIVAATPVVQPGGKISFEFTLALREIPADLPAWEADGVALSPGDSIGTAIAGSPQPITASDSLKDDEPSSLFTAPSHILRVDLSRLDELLRIAGEMVVHRSRLEDQIAKISGDRSGLREVTLAIGRSLRDLRKAITRIRLVPVAEIFNRLPFVIRDLGRDSGKKVRLVLEGQETEIDKYLVERLKEPLLHLARNAISHGVESPSERIAAGKSEEAELLLCASAAGDSVLIQIRDDGRGIDAEKIAARARAMELPVPEVLDRPALLSLICTPGFSTRDEADRAAGRGVGMAVVAKTVRELGGTLTLDTSPGAWTQFTLRLPLTLSIADTFIVSAGAQTCAVPQGLVEEIVEISAADVHTINQAEVAPYRGALLPLVRLSTLFGAEPSPQPRLPVLVVASERRTNGLVVDRVHGQREVVVRAMQDPFVRVPGISGATELGDGKPVLILDAVSLIDNAVRRRGANSPVVLHREAS